MLELKSSRPEGEKYFSKSSCASFKLNFIKLVLLAAIGIIFYSCKSNKAAKNYNTNAAIEKIADLTEDNILVCAHRSFHTNAPENSLQSIKNAIQAKIDIIEIDVRTTKDSILVLMHDKDIDRITTGKGLIKNYTFSELQKFKLKMKDSITEDMLYYHQNTKSPLQHFTDESFTQENMQWIHKNNKIVFVNTLWDEDDSFILGKMEAMDLVIALRPAIIQTDHPLLLINYLRSKKLHK
jgi:glycerophosphoryl diester phosphodiesterase